MRVLIRAALVAVIALTIGTAATKAPAHAAPPGSGACYPIDYTWICIYSGGSSGSGGTGGSATYTCTYTPASPGVLARTGTGPPAPGYQWDIMSCPGSSSNSLGGQLVQVNIATGVPAISPVDLLKIAIGNLSVPALAADTAPPRGRNGLVGLPEWFWVPRPEWGDSTVTVTAGPVWATAIAAPTELTYVPGGGLGSVTCPGPGTPFDRQLPASQQHTRCAYTYRQPSASQPGHAYEVAVAVTWTISWTGSGGAGGVITNGYVTATAFPLRVAQAEALVTTP